MSVSGGARGFVRERLARNPDLAQRVASACAIAALAAIPVLVGGVALFALVAAAAGAMAWELRRILLPAGASLALTDRFYVGVPVLVTLMPLVAAPMLAVAALVAACGAFALGDRRSGLPWRWSAAGLMVIGLACLSFPLLRMMPTDGLLTVLWIIAVVVATDIGAYAFGRAIGGPKLWPRVSPRKTWAGLGGGVLCAVLAGAAFAALTPGTDALLVCAVAAVVALVAQGGDLAESTVKRRFGVKDSSTLIPGHGGVLDRLDGFIAATLAVAVSTLITGRPVFLT